MIVLFLPQGLLGGDCPLRILSGVEWILHIYQPLEVKGQAMMDTREWC